MRKATCTLAVVAAIAAASLSGPAHAQTKPWRHALLNAKADAGIFMMAAKRGFAEKQGLKIDLLQVKDDQIGLKALIAGEVDSFEGGPQGVFAAAARGADVKIIGCHWIVLPHGIYVREGIQKVEDLKGKSVAVSAPNSMPDMLARFALAKYGVQTNEVKLAAVGGDQERYQALLGGVVEAAVVSNEYQPDMPKNLRLLVAGREAVPNFVRVCMVTSGKVLAERGDDVVRFLAAEMQGLRYALSHKTETVALTKEIVHAKEDQRANFVFDDAVANKAVDPDLPIPAEKLDWMQDQLVKAGRLKEPMPLSKVTAPEYREKALKLVGKGN
jgi:NitT/TauT family transport system substrate-binding protein